MNTLGFPSLVDDVLQWVEGDITEQSVAEALQGRGIPLAEGTDQPIVEDSQAPSASSVGQRVADAAAGADSRSWDERIAATENPAELAALMEEAGLVSNEM